ncbi:MAG: rhomboid family intramembrane serine protease [Bryobacteraceae bacterium]
MSYGSYGGRFPQSNFSRPQSNVPPGVKWLLIVNVAVFVAYFLAVRFGYAGLFEPFKLRLKWVVEGFAIWQPVTYLFLHDPLGFGHIFFNMLALFMFGRDLELRWGTQAFLRYYFVCGIGAALCSLAMSAVTGHYGATIGASGAIYGLLLAFGMLFPDQTIWFNFLFPMKAKYFVMIIGAVSFLMTLGATGDNVSHIAHLGGMLWGYLYLKGYLFKDSMQRSRPAVAPSSSGGILQWYKEWKLARARRKFEVYMRKQTGRDTTIH